MAPLLLLLLSSLLVVSGSSLHVSVGLKFDDTALTERYWDVSDPLSASYGKFLTLDGISTLIQPSSLHRAAVIEWLISLGGSDVSVSHFGDIVSARFDTDLWVGKAPRTADAPVPVAYVLRHDPLTTEEAATVPEPSHPLTPSLGDTYSISRQKEAYGIPEDAQATNDATQALCWGPGTYGYSESQLGVFKESECPLLNLDKIEFATPNHGQQGGDNFGEGNLDVAMLAAFGLNSTIIVSNTNTSSSTEEGNGFGAAFLDFTVALAKQKTVPQIVSLSLGSLSPYSCDLLCREVEKKGKYSLSECQSFMQEQRQVCMYISESQGQAIDTALKVLGLRGVSIFGSSGDGGSHFSFQRFQGGELAMQLNEVSCAFQVPVYPTGSPYVVSVGGTQWQGIIPNGKMPEAWTSTGGGFAWQFAAPPHQAKTVAKYLSNTDGLPPKASFNASGRAYPDLASVSVDGTSQSAPATAGIFTLITDMRLSAGLPPLGNLAPRLWAVMEAFPGEAFQDITIGNTKTSCDNGFPATTGWDPVTGWGRPIWTGMVKHFASDDSLPELRKFFGK